MTTIKRGEVYFADLTPVVGSEQGGNRPVVVIQNDIGNKYSPTIIVACITSQMTKAKLPTHIAVKNELPKFSIILLEQLRTIDKIRLGEKVTTLSEETINRINKGLAISIGL